MKKITAFLYDDFTALDLFGPLEALSRLPDHEVRYTSLDGGAVTNHTGLSVSTEKVSQDAHSDILLLPGGFGSRKMVNDRVFLQTLRTMAAHADFVLSVCTGSALLARAGVLEGRKATGNKKSFDWTVSMGPALNGCGKPAGYATGISARRAAWRQAWTWRSASLRISTARRWPGTLPGGWNTAGEKIHQTA